MAVSLWWVLGISFVLLGFPLSYAPTAGDFAFGAGVAFLVVAVSTWMWQRWEALQDEPEAA